MPTVLLVRHGQASFGGPDYDVLSPLGRRQAELAGAELRRLGVSVAGLHCGTLRRQRETAAALRLGAAVEDERWNEFDADELLTHHSASSLRLESDGAPLSSRDFQDHLDLAFRAWMDAGVGTLCRRAWPAFLADGRAALDDVVAGLGSGETAVVVTSAGVVSALAGSLMGAPEPAFMAINRVQVNGAISKVAVGRRGSTLISLNDHSHLEAVGRELVTYR